jgi:hypothetical protein
MRSALADEPAFAADLVDPAPELLLSPLVCPPLDPGQGEGLDLILEGFLLHHGEPRHLRPPGRGRRVLAGDYCYAQGLVRVAAAGDLFVVEALAELIALGAGLVAQGRRDLLAPLWLATAAVIGGRGAPHGDDLALRFSGAKLALRRDEDPGPLRDLAAGLDPAGGLEEAFATPAGDEE